MIFLYMEVIVVRNENYMAFSKKLCKLQKFCNLQKNLCKFAEEITSSTWYKE